MVRIVVPREFEHAGQLLDPEASRDPRHVSFFEELVEVDLRGCRFMKPAALLWCLTYPLVASERSLRVTVRLPTDPTVRHWMVSLGLPEILMKAGIDIDPPELTAAQHVQVVLPLRQFRTPADAEDVINSAMDSLNRSGLGVANTR